MLVSGILRASSDPIPTIGEDAALVEAARRLRGPDAGLVLVCGRDGRLLGVIGKTDVVDRISQCSGASCALPVGSAMTREASCCRPDTPLREVWSTMTSKGLKHLPVLDDDDRPRGIVTARQVMEALVSDVEHEEELLREYVMCIGYR